MRRLFWPILLLLSVVPAVWPLSTVELFKSDDGVVHLFRLHGLDDALRQGILFPRLFPSFAFGYGHAVFSYYGALAYYAGELAHLLGAGFVDALKWAFALGFFGAAFTAYGLARRFATPAAAWLGALVYTYFPYHLVDTYQRGALAEHWAWVFTPLILWGMTPSTEQRVDDMRPAHGWPLLVSALGIAALVVTHSLVAFMFMPVAVIYFWVVNGLRPFPLQIRRFSVMLALGLGLSAFFWLPVALQTRWVQLSAAAEGEGYVNYLAPAHNFVQDVFLFDYSRGEGYPDHPLGLLDGLLLLGSVAVAVAAWRRRERWRLLLSLLIVLSVAAMFLTLDASAPVWHTLYPVMGFLQFPWRLMTLAGFGISMSSVFLFRPYPWLAVLAAPLVMMSALAGLRIRPTTEVDNSDLQAMWRYEYRTKHIGTTWTEEYMPWWVTVDTPSIPRPAPGGKSAQALPVVALRLLDAGYTNRRFTIDAPAALTLRLHQFYFPPWRVTLNGRPLLTYPTTELGLLTWDVPPVTDGTLEIDYGASGAEQTGIWIALAAAAAGLYLSRGRWLLLAFPVVLVIGALWFFLRPHAPAPQNFGASMGGLAELVSAQNSSATVRSGEPLQITLTWLSVRETSEDLQGFIHLVDPNTGKVVAQSDGNPGGGFTPTSQWRSGELVDDTRMLLLPPDVAAGTYNLVAGLYHLQPLQNLPAVRDGQTYPGGQVPIGTIRIVGR